MLFPKQNENFKTEYKYCVKSVKIRSFHGQNTEKYVPEKTPYWDTFHAMKDFEKQYKILVKYM